MKISGTIFQGYMDGLGRVYDSVDLEKAVEQYKKTRIHQGNAVGMIGFPQCDIMNQQDVSHFVTDIEFKADRVVAEITIAHTLSGKLLQEAIESGVEYKLTPAGIGVIMEDVVTDYTIHSINVTDK